MSSEHRATRTRLFHLDMGQVRDHAFDTRTIFTELSDACLPFEALFLASYRSIRELARDAGPGAAIVAVHAGSGRLAGRLWIARPPSRPNVAVLGRHSVCDLVLDCAGVSLRHLALIVPPGEPSATTFALHDLRTPQGLHLELGGRIGGAQVEGAGLFALGPYALFAFATGSPERWPELASEAWRLLAGRTSALSVVRRAPAPSPEPASSPEPAPLFSSTTVISSPIHTDERLLEPGAPREVVLRLSRDEWWASLPLGGPALERGVLLGRYSRCDAGGLFQDDTISRVHALVLRVGGDIFAFDMASTNGLHLDLEAERPTRVVALSQGEIAVLGYGAMMVEIRR